MKSDEFEPFFHWKIFRIGWNHVFQVEIIQKIHKSSIGYNLKLWINLWITKEQHLYSHYESIYVPFKVILQCCCVVYLIFKCLDDSAMESDCKRSLTPCKISNIFPITLPCYHHKLSCANKIWVTYPFRCCHRRIWCVHTTSCATNYDLQANRKRP